MQRFKKIYRTAFVAMAAASLFACARYSEPNSNVAVLYPESAKPSPIVESSPTAAPSPVDLPSPVISPASSPVASPAPSIPPSADEPPPSNNAAVLPSETLMIPVVGIRREDLRDTFKDARSQGRVHDAIDIMAAAGTPVVAAIDGKIIKFFDSERGGITIYQLSPDERTVYYYAHLQRRAEKLTEGEAVKQGTLLGYVGDTGNAGAGNNHLHFAIWTIQDTKRFYDGTNINPYPLLKQGKLPQ